MVRNRRLLLLSSGAMLIVLASLALLASSGAASAPLERPGQATATPECVPPVPAPYLVLTVHPPEVRVGERITLTVEYVNVWVPYFYFGASPGGGIVTDPLRASPCKYDDPDGCEQLTFRARAAGAVTVTGQAFGEIAACTDGHPVLYFGFANPLAPAHLTVLPNGDLPDLRGYASERCDWPGIDLHIENSGKGDAGPFRVSGVEVRFDGLVAGESTTMTLHDPRTPMYIDADDEVVESDESNNEVGRIVPGCRHYLPRLGAGE